ncbi:NAD-dependent succinate-semialdehyde dehydrogenase [Alicyclobacillus acidocaldarius]|uniref:Aldehyde Dehydrogenase n=1 Tax=Alicyclobacillus acidocaldarius subsp. acidocaldarius (strain ATCC 27009 / DSM 446 / BCRC 14685 / JCM 5260 / KCTC 1825 / NBRC 15652 / NCIMB 11725 / NRRL B-14509 / 104-IA) TaxID=521098 RepID=C8WU93_ALIAD|nr:NAD-dependent succinate-semialdehyde dehydrogenase [Alicyclobacillus acidocaldarius]ACV57856.1 Aldehyde Dehydrogenase [Alicyclobacillus acidocaldarius subsp. acidocaldarius DSM 446]
MTDIQKMYIGGEWVDSISGESLEVRNPATGEVVGRAAFGDHRDALRAIDAAHAAFPEWSKLLARERSRYLYRLYELVYQHRNELAELVSAEMGKPIREAKGEVVGSADYFLWYAEEAKRVYGETIPSSFPNKRILVHRQPVGVVAAITPWNFPVNMVARKIAPALAAGCTVVLKPAEATPLSAIRLFGLIHEAGFPPGVANLVIGQPDKVGEAFLKSPKVAKIAFTGSTRVGKLLMAGAAEHVKRVSLELGGHAPTLVFADTDLDLAVKGVFESKFRNTGQMCICTNRLYVERSVAEPFVERLVARVRKAKVGDGRNPEVEIGPIINERGLEKVLNHIEDARSKGAAVVCGGKRLTEGDYAKGYFVEPTVLTGVERGMRVLEEETFGPVLPVAVFDTEDEAIRLANDSPYGLAAYVYTRDLGRAVRVAEALEFGIVGVNDGAPVQTQAPFGGFKESGLGREGGHHAMDEFLEIKHISLAW